MVMIVSLERYPTIKKLKEAIKNNEEVVVEDPSLFNSRVFTIQEMQPGEKICVTNHPKRSYFVNIQRKLDGGYKVQ